MAAIQPRLAIGASQNPTTYDGTAILNLCYGDPGLTPPLTRVRFNDHVAPLFSLREVASLTAPRQFKRTGYGSKLKLEIELLYETTAQGSIFGQEGTDNSLFALASLFGLSSPGASALQGTLYPPYFFVTTTYQTEAEMWIPVELDPSDTKDILHPLGPKTWLRTMAFTFVTQQTYKRIRVTYLPAKTVKEPLSKVVNLPVASGVAPFNTVATLDLPLDPTVQVNDGFLIYFNNSGGLGGGPYVWFRFIITGIDPTRKTINLYQPNSAWPAPGVNFPTTSKATFRTQQADPWFRMPFYAFDAFAGTPPTLQYAVPLPPNALTLGQFI